MDWLTAAQTVGVPAAVLAAIGLGLWRVIVWCGRELVIPTRDRLLGKTADLLDRMDRTLTILEEQVERMAASSEKQTETMTRIDQLCRSEHCDLMEGITALNRKGP